MKPHAIFYTSILIALTTFSHADCPVKPNGELIFFPTFAYLDENRAAWNVPIHGWIYEPEKESLSRSVLLKTFAYLLQLTTEESSGAIFQERARTFLVDNRRRKLVSIILGDQTHFLKRSQPNGHIESMLLLSTGAPHAENTGGTGVHFRTTPCADNPKIFSGEIHFVSPEGTSVISDIDDTIKVSQVNDKKALVRNTFVREFKEVEGMSQLYRSWENNGAKFHYLSASPWQLFPALSQFIQDKGFPSGTFHLKRFRWKDTSFFHLFQSPEKYKTPLIEGILKSFPRRLFILVGDSGEKDPEIYGRIARRYPHQIKHIFIRDTKADVDETDRLIKAFENVPAAIWTVFNNSNELSFVEFGIASPKETPLHSDRETVIVLHGILISPIFMKKVERKLRGAGYNVVNWDYPGRSATIEEHAENLAKLVQGLKTRAKIHFVGFSLGSLVIRHFLAKTTLKNVGRFVMIGPPNHGSEAADHFFKYRWFRLLYGDKSLPQLRASNKEFYDHLPVPSCEFGIIAGVRGNEKGYSDLLPGDDDGTVSLESAKLKGAKDFIALKHQHTPLLFADETRENVLRFLQTGNFIRPQEK